MKTKNKKFIAIVGIAVGAAIFSGAALADLPTSSGYEAGKQAAKGLLQNENYTAEADIKIAVDGVEQLNATYRELYDRDGNPKLNSEHSEKSADNGSYESKQYFQDNQSINYYKYTTGEESTSVYDAEEYGWTGRGAFDSMNTANDEDKVTANKIIKFVELISDTLIGDLKNNIVYVGGDDDSASYELNLSQMQIPEFVNAGLQAMFGTTVVYADADEEPMARLGADPVVKNIALKFTVDGQKRLSDLSANVTLIGNGHELTFDVNMKLYNYGTTKPERVDISTLPNVEEQSFDDTVQYTIEADSLDNVEHITDDGAALDADGNVIGHMEVQADGSGKIVFD